MKIRRLDIFGFKSFVDKVSLEFEHGITGIVGPNGCGKSNILDAIRWVMGEQNVRHLRGRSMEDIIFGGSESRKPTGLAQVSMVLDNSAGNCPAIYKDFAEIMVTRKLYRSGESEYLINKTPCRLLDINELFMDTGVGARAYSIIEQGKVGALVSAKPEERRALIEEAAGVTKFKSRKKTALRKMDATRQNLLRLGDIITEVRRQLGGLQRQAQKAEQYRELRREARRIELSLSGNRLQRLDDEIALLLQQEDKESKDLAVLDGRLDEGEVRLEERQLQLSQAEAGYNQAQQKDYQLAADIQRLESEINLVFRQQEQQASQKQQTLSEVDQCSRRLDELTIEADELRKHQHETGSGVDALKEQIAGAETELAEILTQEAAVSARHEVCRQEQMEQFAQANRLQNRREEIERRLETEKMRRQQLVSEQQQITQRLTEVETQKGALARRRADIDSERQQVRDRLELSQEELLVRKNQLSHQQALYEQCRKRLEQANSRYESLEDLQRNREGCSDGTRALLAGDGTRRIVADLMRVAAVDEAAVEAALGDRLQAVLAESPELLTAGLDLLQQQQVRGMLLYQQPHGPMVKGVVDFARGTSLLSRVTPVTGAEVFVRQLLAGIFMVESVADHLDAELLPGMLLVDSQGRCLDWQGMVGGGNSEATGAGLLRRQRQLEDLAKLISQLQGTLSAELATLERQQELLAETEEAQICAQSESHRLELQTLDLEKDEQALQAENDHLTRRLTLLDFDLEQIRIGERDLQNEHARYQSGREGAIVRQQQLEQQSQQLQQQLTQLRTQLDQGREALTARRVALAALQQQQQGGIQTLERIDRQLREVSERRSQLQQRLTTCATSQQQLQLKEGELRAELDRQLDNRAMQQQQTLKLQEIHSQLRVDLDEFRDQLRRLRTDAEELRKSVARIQLRQREQQLEAEHLYQGVLERFAIDLRLQKVPVATDADLDRQQQQLQRLQQKINVLGEVNLMAIEEYQEQEKRYDFLIQQRDDLKQSLDDLEKAIAQINRTTRRRFKETFDQANEKFRQVFPRLFRGGQAELRLTDEHDLLETGVEINVQPPGKRLQSVNLLSGGEKALTAVALIFSLFLLKPTPFCVLDEVDAPLDDANIDRFAEMVRDMTDRSQFILITHSKRTMSIVDTLYGVTMQEPGVSRLVSVRVSDKRPELKPDSISLVEG